MKSVSVGRICDCRVQFSLDKTGTVISELRTTMSRRALTDVRIQRERQALPLEMGLERFKFDYDTNRHSITSTTNRLFSRWL